MTRISLKRLGSRLLTSKLVVILMVFLIVAALVALVLAGLEVDLLEHFREHNPLRNLLEIEEILVLTMVLVLGLFAFAIRRMLQQNKEIRRRQAAEHYALELAFHDPLTGLPNRRQFMETLDKSLSTLPRGDNVHAVMLVDLNSFKEVNDVHGHPTGDELLIDIGHALTQAAGAESLIARLGGDEFALLACDLENPDAAAGLARRLIEALQQPFPTSAGELRVGGGIGISLAPRDSENGEELVRRADLALYRAKAEGSSAFAFFEAAMDAHMRERAFMEGELRAALGTDALSPSFQPNVELETNRVTGFDVTPQWLHSTLGLVPPQRFIPVAEDSGLIRELTDQIMRRAFLDAISWPDETILSFRLSDALMRDPRLAPRILGIVSGTRFAPKRLEIAIGEATLMRNMDDSRHLLAPLREAGIKLALADFGTSYSSIWHLRDLHFDKLKIDKSFILDLEGNKNSAVIVRTVLGMGQGLGIAVSADGIEKGAQRDLLVKQGLGEGQGDLFGRALSAEEASALFASQTLKKPVRA